MGKSDLILATGGPGMVRAAYSSGRPTVESEQEILL